TLSSKAHEFSSQSRLAFDDLLTFQIIESIGQRFEPPLADWLATALAETICAVIQPLQRRIDLLQQRPRVAEHQIAAFGIRHGVGVLGGMAARAVRVANRVRWNDGLIALGALVDIIFQPLTIRFESLANRRRIVVYHSLPSSRIYRFMPKHRTYLVPASAGRVAPEPRDPGQRLPLHRRFDCPTNCRPVVLSSWLR